MKPSPRLKFSLSVIDIKKPDSILWTGRTMAWMMSQKGEQIVAAYWTEKQVSMVGVAK